MTMSKPIEEILAPKPVASMQMRRRISSADFTDGRRLNETKQNNLRESVQSVDNASQETSADFTDAHRLEEDESVLNLRKSAQSVDIIRGYQ